MKNQIIIARFMENIEWIKQLLPYSYIDSIIVYNKGNPNNLPIFNDERITIISKKNIGREGGTYLDHILNNLEI